MSYSAHFTSTHSLMLIASIVVDIGNNNIDLSLMLFLFTIIRLSTVFLVGLHNFGPNIQFIWSR